MTYNIDCFTCTVQGIIAIETQDSTLSKDELSILQFVNSYNHSYNKETLRKIESRFRQIYESVNLTRLVVLKYLEIKNQNSGLFASDLLSALSKSERFVVQKPQHTHIPDAASPATDLEDSEIFDIPNIPDTNTKNTGVTMANAQMPAAPELEDARQINTPMSPMYAKGRFDQPVTAEIDPILNLINGKMHCDINDELRIAV